MRTTILCIFLSLLMSPLAHSQDAKESDKYLGQTPPSLQPEIFAPGLISQKNQYEFGSVFNKDATAFFYAVDANGKADIRYSELVGKQWSEPKIILSHEQYGFNDPFLSPDEQRLYFISQKKREGSQAGKNYDIWYVKKQKNGWSEPINAGPQINSDRDEYYISFTKEGSMYFASNKLHPETATNSFDIYVSKSKDGEFQTPSRLGPSINTSHYEADVFIAPDESYIIFCANRPEGLGRGDLYISFKKDDGSWTKSINMGDKINTSGHELCPYVSMDGKYFFYTSRQDIYWVSTQVFDELK